MKNTFKLYNKTIIGEDLIAMVIVNTYSTDVYYVLPKEVIESDPDINENVQRIVNKRIDEVNEAQKSIQDLIDRYTKQRYSPDVVGCLISELNYLFHKLCQEYKFTYRKI